MFMIYLYSKSHESICRCLYVSLSHWKLGENSVRSPYYRFTF